MLQLAAATGVRDVMRTGRFDPFRTSFDQAGDPPAGKARLGPHLTEFDQIPWRGARHEDRAAILQPSDSVAAGRDALDPGQRRPSVRAARSQSELS